MFSRPNGEEALRTNGDTATEDKQALIVFLCSLTRNTVIPKIRYQEHLIQSPILTPVSSQIEYGRQKQI